MLRREESVNCAGDSYLLQEDAEGAELALAAPCGEQDEFPSCDAWLLPVEKQTCHQTNNWQPEELGRAGDRCHTLHQLPSFARDLLKHTIPPLQTRTPPRGKVRWGSNVLANPHHSTDSTGQCYCLHGPSEEPSRVQMNNQTKYPWKAQLWTEGPM